MVYNLFFACLNLTTQQPNHMLMYIGKYVQVLAVNLQHYISTSALPKRARLWEM